MSVTLAGSQGELGLVRITVAPHFLEDLLDALSGLSFPVNPQILHLNPETVVEFPAYSAGLEEVRRLFRQHPVELRELEVISMLAAIQCQDRGQSPLFAT